MIPQPKYLPVPRYYGRQLAGKRELTVVLTISHCARLICVWWQAVPDNAISLPALAHRCYRTILVDNSGCERVRLLTCARIRRSFFSLIGLLSDVLGR